MSGEDQSEQIYKFPKYQVNSGCDACVATLLRKHKKLLELQKRSAEVVVVLKKQMDKLEKEKSELKQQQDEFKQSYDDLKKQYDELLLSISYLKHFGKYSKSKESALKNTPFVASVMDAISEKKSACKSMNLTGTEQKFQFKNSIIYQLVYMYCLDRHKDGGFPKDIFEDRIKAWCLCK